MAWRGSLSRSLMSTARVFNSSPSLSASRSLRPPPLSAPRIQVRSRSFSNPRHYNFKSFTWNFTISFGILHNYFLRIGELGCAQSLMPLATGVRLTSHLSVKVLACSELSHGMEKMGDVSSDFHQIKSRIMVCRHLKMDRGSCTVFAERCVSQTIGAPEVFCSGFCSNTRYLAL
ncbi:light-independent protochlorophyllide reductase subunit N, partial [Striga asiatica]